MRASRGLIGIALGCLALLIQLGVVFENVLCVSRFARTVFCGVGLSGRLGLLLRDVCLQRLQFQSQLFGPHSAVIQ